MFNLDDYNFELPDELIAQTPAERRDNSRLLAVDKVHGSFQDHRFFELPQLLTPGDLLVVNNTQVVPARLFGRKASGGKIEILVLEHAPQGSGANDTRWCLLKSSKRPSKGSQMLFGDGLFGFVEDLGEDGLVRITFQGPTSIDRILDEQGAMPLPPYIKRQKEDVRAAMDRERYQTIFSNERGAVAAPTAGLHFTRPLVDTLIRSGIDLVAITLHVGHGTFRPVKTEDIRDHNLGEERFHVSQETAMKINRCKKEGRRVIAVGTTVVRTLETLASPGGRIAPGSGATKLLITPGYPFRIIEGLITNFHLPKSSLLFLVSAFAGIDVIRNAYRWAIEKRYRFFSYGDAMVIL